MAWMFSLSAECGTEQAAVEEFAKHFDKVSWIISIQYIAEDGSIDNGNCTHYSDSSPALREANHSIAFRFFCSVPGWYLTKRSKSPRVIKCPTEP